MADHFLAKTRIELADCLPAGDMLAIERYETLARLLEERAGAPVARLFAEPLISRGNDVASPTIAWYTDFEGTGVPWSDLDEEARGDLSDVLSRRLGTIPEAITADEDGRLLAAALHTLGPDSVWSVGGRPVIMNWAMLPEAARGDPRTRDRHFRNTLGRFIDIPAPPLEAEEVAGWTTGRKAAAASVAGVAAAGAASAAGATAAGAATANTGSGKVPPTEPPPTTPPAGPRRDARRAVPLYAWLPLAILLLLSAGVLGWLLMPGTRLFADTPPAPAVTDAEAVRLAGGVNEALRTRIATLEKALEGATCKADGTLLMPEGIMIEGMLPPSPQTPLEAQGRRVTAAAQPVLPPDLTRVMIGPEGDRTTLREIIEARTVMVLVRSDRGISAGTGFVAGPGTVVTNFHVVDGALPGGIQVTNRTLGETRPAELLKITGPFDQSGSDFALLQVRGLELPAFPIHVSDASIRNAKVYAAGYPGDALAGDAEFDALRAGDSSAVPTLTVTDGTVNVEQSLKGRISVLEHSAPISRGNSGGPLVDACGRLVGVNTFVHKGALRDLNLAQSSRNLVEFLQNTPAVASVVSTPCTPEVLRPSVRSAANGADPVPEPAPDPATRQPEPGGAPILPKLVKPQP